MAATYITQDGDMWDSIALSQIGDTYYSNQLMNANLKYSDVVIFDAGVILNIPDVSTVKSAINLPPWAR